MTTGNRKLSVRIDLRRTTALPAIIELLAALETILDDSDIVTSYDSSLVYGGGRRDSPVYLAGGDLR